MTTTQDLKDAVAILDSSPDFVQKFRDFVRQTQDSLQWKSVWRPRGEEMLDAVPGIGYSLLFSMLHMGAFVERCTKLRSLLEERTPVQPLVKECERMSSIGKTATKDLREIATKERALNKVFVQYATYARADHLHLQHKAARSAMIMCALTAGAMFLMPETSIRLQVMSIIVLIFSIVLGVRKLKTTNRENVVFEIGREEQTDAYKRHVEFLDILATSLESFAEQCRSWSKRLRKEFKSESDKEAFFSDMLAGVEAMLRNGQDVAERLAAVVAALENANIISRDAVKEEEQLDEEEEQHLEGRASRPALTGEAEEGNNSSGAAEDKKAL